MDFASIYDHKFGCEEEIYSKFKAGKKKSANFAKYIILQVFASQIFCVKYKGH
jgi:hypothetical protein